MLSVALKLFASEGYENVGIQRIVEAVNVTKPTLYHYFGSKHGLLVALLNCYFGPFLENLRQSAIYQQRDITMTLERIAKTYFRFAAEQPEFYRLALAMMYAPAESEVSKTMYPILEQQYQILANGFLQAEKDHGNMRGRSNHYLGFRPLPNRIFIILNCLSCRRFQVFVFGTVEEVHGNMMRISVIFPENVTDRCQK